MGEALKIAKALRSKLEAFALMVRRAAVADTLIHPEKVKESARLRQVRDYIDDTVTDLRVREYYAANLQDVVHGLGVSLDTTAKDRKALKELHRQRVLKSYHHKRGGNTTVVLSAKAIEHNIQAVRDAKRKDRAA